jgi:hypothetical protein
MRFVRRRGQETHRYKGEEELMSKFAISAVLALGIGAAAPVASHAAAVPIPAGMQAAVASIDTVQFAQYVNKKPVVVGRPVGRPAGVVGRPVGVVGRPVGVVGRPVGVVGRPVGVVGRPVGVVGPGRVYGRPVGVVGPGRVVGGPRFVYGYRPWYRRPHFGTIVGGVALGTILTVAAVGAAPAVAPAPGLCWYWADEYQSQGYWDYC